MSRPTDSSIRQAIGLFEKAVRADEWKGSQHPDDREAIETKYKKERERLFEYIRKVSGG